MKLKILFITLLFSSFSWGQIAAWDFFGTGSPTASATLGATTYNASLDASNLITRGATAAGSVSLNNFRTTGFQNNGIATANTDYFQVTLSATTGNTLSLSTIDARFAGTASYCVSPGVSNQFAYSLDGTTFNLISTPQLLISTPAALSQIDLTGISALQNVAAVTTVTFRFYASGQTTTGGWGFASSTVAGTNGLAIGGTINSTSPPAVALSDNGTQITAGNVAQGTTNHILSTFKQTVTNSAALLSDASFITSGTYRLADIATSGFTLWCNTSSNTFSTATAVSTLSSASSGTGEILTFTPATAVTLPVGASYFWVTATVDAAATTGRTIRIDAIASADFTFGATTTKSGSSSVAGYQTITIGAPSVPGSLTKGCTTNTSQVLNWSAPASGTYDGYLLVVRQGGVPNAVTTIYVPTQITDLDYSAAPTYNATTSRVLYKTTAAATVSVTVMGLTAGLSYTFAVYAYKNNGASTLYSATATTTTQTIGIANVTSATVTAGNTTASLTWVNPTAACFDQVLVVVTAASGITFVPTGSTNTAYTPNTVFSGFNQAVYYSSGNLANMTGLINGTTYYLEIFVRNGSEWSSGVEVSVTPVSSTPTLLKTGDLVLIAYNNNLSSGDDGIRLLSLVDINPGTSFLWTNATYETGGKPVGNNRTDKWFECRFDVTPTGNVPYIEFTYTGATLIPAASVFCFTTKNTNTATTITAVSPSGTVFSSFTISGKSADGTILSPTHGAVNVSTTNPDSMFLLQGSFTYDPAGSSFVGTVLSGVQDGGLWYDLTDDLSAISGVNLRRSRKHPQLLCASIQANLSPAAYQVSYNVSSTTYTTGSRPYLLGSILNYATNWVSSFGVCPASSPFIITASDAFNKWTGGTSTNWFDCNNWAQLTVPDELTDVVVLASATRDAIIDYTAPYSDGFLDIAKCKDLTISGRKVQLQASANNKLDVYGDLLLNTSGVLDMDDSDGVTADGNLYLRKHFTNSLLTTNFEEGNGTVSFIGSSPQVINLNDHTNPEQFYNVILDNDFNTTTSNNLIATGNLEVKVNKYVTIGSATYPNDYIRVHNKLTTNGDITIENNGQLIQVNDTDTNDGDYSGTKFTVKRDYTARDIDYVYWSAPTKLFAVANLPNGYRYEWNPVFSNTNGTFGNWIAPAAANMIFGKGYIARTFNGSSTTATNTFSFRGQPNNGTISIPISRANIQGLITDPPLSYPLSGSVTKWDDNWNLVGNPYPSAINALTFLAAVNNPDIEGFVYIWSHGTIPSAAIADPFYNDFVINYTTNDYIIYNGTGTASGPSGFNGKIASGQGFFVLMKDGATASGTVNFNNSMRRNTTTDASYTNTQFYRNSTVAQTVVGEVEKSRIWLDIVSPQNAVKRTLIGYVETATNEKDRLFDAVTKPNNLDLYSFIDNDPVQEYCIQGRAMPFLDTDKVNLGIKVGVAGVYKIAIAAVDGLFSQNQAVYLEDKLANVIYDLRQAPYSFSSDAGKFNDRFVLRYTNSSLGNPNFETSHNQVVVTTNDGEMTIKSYRDAIEAVTVYNLLGRQLFSAKAINNLLFTTSDLITNQTLLVKVKLTNGTVVSRKVIL